jgi:hypothetical protein
VVASGGEKREVHRRNTDMPVDKRKDRAFKKNMIHESAFRSICEVLREIYWETEDPNVRLKSIEASMMAKKMARKLIEYNFDIGPGMDYDELSVEDREAISAERWVQYKEEVDRGIEHPMNKPEEENDGKEEPSENV